MKLVLAEKPSVAMSLSKVIGADQRGDGYMEGNGYLVSWCVGHLVELSQPEAYDEKYAKWKYDDLPILPEHWQYQVSASTKKQFGILKKLMQRKDVESLICATDAGREGELIFRLVYHQCGCKKPVERLWISSMEDSAIREGFQKLRPGTEYDPYMRRLYAGSEPTGLSESTPPGFFMSVWADPECGARDDTNACDGGYARCSNPGVQAGAVLLGRIKISGFSSGR